MARKTTEVKSCPFCGEKAISHDGHKKYVKCPDDNCPGGQYWNDVSIWNKRAVPSEKYLEIERQFRDSLSEMARENAEMKDLLVRLGKSVPADWEILGSQIDPVNMCVEIREWVNKQK